MDVGRAFNAPFKDRNWVGKTALGGLLFLVPILNWVVYGAMVSYVKRVSAGREDMPEWGDDFGGMFAKGFFVFLAGLIFAIPAIILSLIALIPLIGAIAAASGNPRELSGLVAASGGLTCLIFFVIFVYGIFISIYLYAAITHYAMKDNFGAFFEFGEVFARMRTPGAGFWVAWLMAIVLGFGGAFVGGIISSILSVIPVLGSLAGFYISYAILYLVVMMVSHMFGQYAQRAYNVTPVMPAPAIGAAMPGAYPAPGQPVQPPYQPPAPPAPAAPPQAYQPPPPPAAAPPAAPPTAVPAAAPAATAPAPSAPPAEAPPAAPPAAPPTEPPPVAETPPPATPTSEEPPAPENPSGTPPA